MIINGDTTKSNQDEDEEDREDSSELTRERPSRMTHGHWLRRYSGLHTSDGGASTDQTAPHSPLASPAATSPTAVAAGQERHQQHQTSKKRPRLLTRWTTAMWATGQRSVPMGGSQADVTAKSSHLLAAPDERAGASSAPPASASIETADWHHRRRESQTSNAAAAAVAVTLGGSRKSRARRPHNSAAKLANGSVHQFGCQFCGWRSHAPSSSCSSCSSIAAVAASPACAVDTAPSSHRARSSTGKLASWLMRSTPSPRQAAADSAHRVELSPSLPRETDRKWQQLPVLDVGGAQHEDRPPSLRRASPYRQLTRFLGAAAAGKQGELREQQQQQQVGAACTNAKVSTRSLVASLFASPRKRRSDGGVQMGAGLESRDKEKFATRGDEVERPIHLTKSDSRDKMSRTANANEISKGIECTQEESKLNGEEMTVASRQVNDNFKLAPPCASDITTTTASPGSDQLEDRNEQEEERDERAPNGSSSSGLLQPLGLGSEADARNANESRGTNASLRQFRRQSGPRGEDDDNDDQAQFQLNQTPTQSAGGGILLGNSKLVTASGTGTTSQLVADPSTDQTSPVTSRLISLAATAAQGRQFKSSTGNGTQPAASNFAPLIQPTLAASSSSSFASSSINLDSAADQSQQRDLSPIVTSSIEKSAPLARPPPVPEATANQDDQMASRIRPHSQPTAAAKRQVVEPANVQNETNASISGSTFGLRTNFKKLVKRQQSVDSYRMARDLKQKLKRQQQQQEGGGGNGTNRQGHHSHETIKSDLGSRAATSAVATSGRKFSMRSPLAAGGGVGVGNQLTRMPEAIARPPPPAVVEICVDPYARPGTFMLPGEQMTAATGSDQVQSKSEDEQQQHQGQRTKQVRVSPQPPKTLSLMPATAVSGTNGHSPVVSQSCVSPGGSLLMGSGFSGCITPTYPTHHLPSPKYVSPAAFMAMQKKHSNASTISSSLGVDLGVGPASGNNNAGAGGQSQTLTLAEAAAAGLGKSDTESSFSLTPSGRASKTIDEQQQQQQLQEQSQGGEHKETPDSNGAPAAGATNGTAVSDTTRANQAEVETAAAATAAAAAQRRANLAEHIYDNKCGLGEDMKFLASLPELCDITFLVGETREPVCAVKSVLAARSRVFHKIFFGSRIKAAAAAAAAVARAQAQAAAHDEQSQQVAANHRDQTIDRRRDSSPRSTGRNSILVTGPSISPSLPKSSVPNSRSSSPSNQQQPQWSVTADTSGLSSTSPQRTTTTGGVDSSKVGVAGGRGGRVSVTSNGRESISQASQGSTQPLIIGPGQVATPAPVPKGGSKSKSKGRLRDQPRGGGGGGGDGDAGGHSRLSRMFLNKRASDPSIKHQQQQQNNNSGANDEFGGSIDSGGQHPPGYPPTNGVNQSYLDKMSSSQKSTTMIIEEFEPDVFRQLIEYIHTGCVLLQARTLLGLLNAADYYGLEQLRRACLRFVSCCITVDTVCSLLSTAERYIQYKCTKSIVQKVLEFVDTHANEIFKLNAFGLLPEHVVRLILARDGLQADEHAKYNGVYTWCEHYCRSYELTNMSDVMHNFLNLIQFHKIPTTVLLTEIYPCHIVPDDIFLGALAYQADPEVFEAPPSRQPRRMTLPNSIMLKTAEPPEHQQRHSQDCSVSKSTGGGGESISGRQSSNSPASGSQQSRQLLGSRKSTGGAPNWTPTPSPPTAAPKQVAGRRGSIAQVSLSGVKRLSHKLSIKRRHHSNMPPASSSAGSSENRRRRGSGGAFSLVGRSSELSKQASLAARTSVAGSNLHQTPVAVGSRDPIEVGRQILDAYLEMKRQQELEEEARRQREEDELRAAEEAKRRATGANNASGRNSDAAAQQSRSTSSSSRKPLVKTPSSTRKSFRDFKHISRRIFMRHSSSKTIQVEQSQSQCQSPTNSGGGGGGGKVNSSSHYRLGSREMSSDSGTGLQPKRFSSMDKSQEGSGGQAAEQQTKVRRLMKIKRSETVFEAATSLPGKLTYQRNKNNHVN